MSELRLDYFLSLGLKLVEGDVFSGISDDSHSIAVRSSTLEHCNQSCARDKEFSIDSLTPRKNTGEQPCCDDMPVIVFNNAGKDNKGIASKAQWHDLKDDFCTITSWKPDLQKLIEMQTESDKLTSSDIEWLDDDVVAVIKNGEREVHLRFSFESKDCFMFDDAELNFNGHKFNTNHYYLVYRKANKTVEAVNRFNGGFPFFAVESGEKLITQSLTDDSGVKIGEFDFGGKTHNKSMFLQVCTETEFNQCVTDLSEAAWLNKDAPGEPQYYEMHKKAVADMKAVENKKPVYTQAMKDAGELPGVGMSAVAVSAASNWGVVEVVYINKVQFVCIDDNGDVLIHYLSEEETFKPIDTLTPAEKQVESVASELLAISNGKGGFEDAALHLQKIGLLAEL